MPDADLLPLLPNLRRYALSLTRSHDAADDLVQATVVRALAKSHLYHPDTDLRAWLFTIMHNTHVNGVRRAVRESVVCVDPDVLASLPAPPADPTGRLQLAEVRAALGRLPRRVQRLIWAAAVSGDDYEAMAEFEGVPVGTVRSRLSRGRAELRLLLAGTTLSPEEREKLSA